MGLHLSSFYDSLNSSPGILTESEFLLSYSSPCQPKESDLSLACHFQNRSPALLWQHSKTVPFKISGTTNNHLSIPDIHLYLSTPPLIAKFSLNLQKYLTAGSANNNSSRCGSPPNSNHLNPLVLLIFNSKKGLGTPGFKKLFEI